MNAVYADNFSNSELNSDNCHLPATANPQSGALSCSVFEPMKDPMFFYLKHNLNMLFYKRYVNHYEYRSYKKEKVFLFSEDT
jgi:hypothetical protein